HIKSVIASRWYYYEARNPWGTTRSALAKVTTAHDQKPLLLTKGPLVAYLGVPFTHQLDGAYNTGFELAGTAPGWLSLDRTTGILRGTPSGAAGTSTTCAVRAVQEKTSETNRSSTVTLQIALKASEEWEGTIALRYFTPEEAANPDIGGGEADPDNDGIPNKAEYVLGLCPTCPDSNETKPLFLLSGNQATMLLERSQERSHSPYNIETSTDVGQWKPLGITGNVIQTQNGREGVSYSISTTNQGFLRLKTH
ncbi:MAG TPA: putative Ig domain-containing protein, partial [Clostridia bacterium]|nr:putative Ig domain-containing protein [Clostridia bacterium]